MVTTYIDNIYSLANTAASAIKILEDFEAHISHQSMEPFNKTIFKDVHNVWADPAVHVIDRTQHQ